MVCNRGYTDVQYVAMLGQYYSGALLFGPLLR